MRQEYLFALTHLCNVTPAASWDLTLMDFSNLIQNIDKWVEAQNQQG